MSDFNGRPDDIIVTSEKFHRLVDTVYYLLQDKGVKIDHVFCLWRGGAPFAIEMSHLLDVKCHAIGAIHYADKRVLDEVQFSRHTLFMTPKKRDIKGNILLCDEMTETRKSLEGGVKKIYRKFGGWWLVNRLFRGGKKRVKVYTAIFHLKLMPNEDDLFQPDIVVERIPANDRGKHPWIVYPWERKNPLYTREQLFEKELQVA